MGVPWRGPSHVVDLRGEAERRASQISIENCEFPKSNVVIIVRSDSAIYRAGWSL